MTINTQLSNYASFSTRFPTFAVDITEHSYSLSVAPDTEVQFAVPTGGASFFRATSAGGVDLVVGTETTPAAGAYGSVQQGLFEINPGMRHFNEEVSTIFVRNLSVADTTIVNVTFYKG